MAGDLILNDTGVAVQGTLTAQDVTISGNLKALHNEIHSTGGVAGFSFTDRSNANAEQSGGKGDRFVWYADHKSARLWSQGDLLSVSWGDKEAANTAFVHTDGVIECGALTISTGSKTHFVSLELELMAKRIADLEKAVAALTKK